MGELYSLYDIDGMLFEILKRIWLPMVMDGIGYGFQLMDGVRIWLPRVMDGVGIWLPRVMDGVGIWLPRVMDGVGIWLPRVMDGVGIWLPRFMDGVGIWLPRIFDVTGTWLVRDISSPAYTSPQVIGQLDPARESGG